MTMRPGLHFSASLAFIALLFSAHMTIAQEEVLDCAGCHDEVVITSTTHTDEDCLSCHSNVLEEEHEASDLTDLDGDAMCEQCHARIKRQVGRSVHKDNSECKDCHGPTHSMHKLDELDSAVSPFQQVKTCGACHEEPAGLVDGFIDSAHGRGLLRSGLISAPSCSSCHGDHGTKPIDHAKAETSHANAPDMCGTCHVGVLETWQNESAHGSAWLDDNADAPVCTNCHESHVFEDPTLGEGVAFR